MKNNRSKNTAIITTIIAITVIISVTVFIYKYTIINDNNKSESLNKEIPVTNLEITSKEEFLSVGDTKKLNVIIFPDNATNKKLFWESSNNEIVTVDEVGNIKALKEGQVTITVTSQNKQKAECNIIISDNDNINDVQIEFNNLTSNIQKQHKIKIAIMEENIKEIYYAISNDNKVKPNINTPIANNSIINLANLTGIYYIWIKVINNNNNIYYKVSDEIHIDNKGPEIVFVNNGNLNRNATENEGTVINVTDNMSKIEKLYYTWSKTNINQPEFKNTFTNGQKINKQKNSNAYYLWIKACDNLENCTIKVSEPFVGTLIADKTVIRPRLDMCATSKLTDSQINILNKVFNQRLNSVNTKRAKTVAAAKFLSEEFPYQIPYYLNNGLSQDQTDGRYFNNGMFLQPLIGWGCPREFKKNPTPTNTSLRFVKGKSYPNGFDCSGFVTWAIKNGGVSEDIIGNFLSYDFEKYAKQYGCDNTNNHACDSIQNNLSSIKKRIRPGDIVFMTGHVGIVTNTTNNYITIAESKGSSSNGGVQSNTYTYSNFLSSNFEYVIYLCDAYEDC